MPNKVELDQDLLRELLACHATSGDEAQVCALLERQWRRAQWRIRRLGDYAVTASARAGAKSPVLLVCAHMDSPGYAIHASGAGVIKRKGQSACARPVWKLTPIGGPSFTGPATPGLLKYAGGTLPVVIGKARGAGAADDEDDTPDITCTATQAVAPGILAAIHAGDRVCFAAAPAIDADRITSPFLDNRLGCWLTAELPRLAQHWHSRYRIVVAATASEECTGHGAAVLAHHLRPDLTLILDTTYANAEQRVALGGGPVLTLCDRSVLISPARRDALREAFARAAIPLQTEVYNYSGTDARAFPSQGVFTPVLPLLIATTGNHSPQETADLRDADTLLRAIRLLAELPGPL